MRLRNLMEKKIAQVIDELLANADICDCPKCRLDMAAIALNQLPPRYVVTDRGASYGKTDFLVNQKTVDLLRVAAGAIRRVARDPRHSDSVSV